MNCHVRKFRVTLLAGLMLFALGSFCQADGLFMRLPEDGTWAKYSLELDFDDRPISGNLIIRSVGQETVAGAAYRWIEVSMEIPYSVTTKILVPEEQLKAGGSPLKNASKIYFCESPGEIAQVDDLKSVTIGPFAAFLGGPLQDAEKLEANTTKTAAGEFECQGVKGKRKLQERSRMIDVTEESRFSDAEEAAFGVVQYKLEVSTPRGHNGNIELNLIEIGDDAKPSIEVKADDDGK